METSIGTPERPELIFALVGPAGVRLDDLSRALKEQLANFQYKTVDIRLSDLLKNFNGWKDETDNTEYTRITHRQDLGYQFRKGLNDGAALARAALVSIRENRAVLTGNSNKPASAYAYIIHQLKHPREVELLRLVYGPSLVVIAGHALYGKRVESLAKRLAQKEGQAVNGLFRSRAEEIIHVDEKQEIDDDLGQNTRDTYPLADYFANLGPESGENSVKRFVDLLFGHPFHTPVPEEFAMYQASAGALRSSDESRQVGAVIVSLSHSRDVTGKVTKITNADVVASGMNEVPRRGGGFYWHEDSPDGRDQWLIANYDEDRAKQIKISALMQLIDKIREQKWLDESLEKSPSNQLANDLFPKLKGTQFMDIGEFMRPVHAEMAALIDSARRGVAVHGLTMYVTAFPCHNCAKHIIAAGLRKVVYLEPYPKSRAAVLHKEEINLESIDESEQDDRVIFSAFTGIAPRQYQTVFSMSARGRKAGLALKEWNAARATLRPRYVPRNAAASYLLAECQELEKLNVAVYKWDPTKVYPTS